MLQWWPWVKYTQHLALKEFKQKYEKFQRITQKPCRKMTSFRHSGGTQEMKGKAIIYSHLSMLQVRFGYYILLMERIANLGGSHHLGYDTM